MSSAKVLLAGGLWAGTGQVQVLLLGGAAVGMRNVHKAVLHAAAANTAWSRAYSKCKIRSCGRGHGVSPCDTWNECKIHGNKPGEGPARSPRRKQEVQGIGSPECPCSWKGLIPSENLQSCTQSFPQLLCHLAPSFLLLPQNLGDLGELTSLRL